MNLNTIEQIIASEIPRYGAEKRGLTFEQIGVDSFELLSVRIAIEQYLGEMISDADWVAVTTPADIIALATSNQRANDADGQSEVERLLELDRYTIGMPHLAINGLSETWLFKEVGDHHWQLIMKALGTSSSKIADGNGERLYATFTRFKVSAPASLRAFRENSEATLSGSISRYGAGVFIGRYRLEDVDGDAVEVTLMSSFAKRGEASSNKGLQKGQPAIPAGCEVPAEPTKPTFMQEYADVRRAERPQGSFSCEYQINPYHDFNGVGLLYFAAYPGIADTCELQFAGEGNGWASRVSTVDRDIFYFGNSDLDETVRYEVLEADRDDEGIRVEALLSRITDGAPMAIVRSFKRFAR